MDAARPVTTLAAALAAAVALHAPAAPPSPGRGYGLPLRTIDGVEGVRSVLVSDDGVVTAALGPAGVVRIGRDGTRETVVPWWPVGTVADAEAIAGLPDGRIAIADPARGALAIAGNGTTVVSFALKADDVPVRPVGIAAIGERIYLADGATPRVVVAGPDGAVRETWPVPAPAGGLRPLLGGIAAAGEAVLVTDVANDRVVVLSTDEGAVRASSGDRGAFPGMWQWPAGASWDGSAFVVTDLLNHRVVRMGPDAKPIDQFGQHAVRPREGNGKIHYPTVAAASPDGATLAVAEPFERRIQLFGGMPDPDPKAPKSAPLPTIDGVSSHFSTELALDGRTLLVYEPESASALIFDLHNDPPIHVTTFGGAGRAPGQFGQVTALCVDEASNRLWLADPLRGVLSCFALRRDGTAPHFDQSMARLVREIPLDRLVSSMTPSLAVPGRLWPVDLCMTREGTIVLLDAFGPRLIEIAPDGRVVAATGGWKGEGRMVLPTQCAIAENGDVLVVDAAEHAVKRYARGAGSFRGLWKLDSAKRPFGIAAMAVPGGSPDSVRYAVTDASGDRLMILDPSTGTVVAEGGTTGAKPGELWEPSAIAWCPADGRLYVTDHGNHRIQTFTPDTAWQSSFGIGRSWVRPKDPGATAPVRPQGKAPSAEGAADTRGAFPDPVRGTDGWWTVPSAGGTWNVRWKFTGAKDGMPPVRDPFGLEVEVRAAAGGTPFGGALLADAAMPQHGHGMNVRPTVRALGGGRFAVDGMLFHMPGAWELYLDLVQDGALERAQATVVLE